MSRLKLLFGLRGTLLAILSLGLAGGSNFAFVSIRQAVLRPLPELSAADKSFVVSSRLDASSPNELHEWGRFAAFREHLPLATVVAAEGMTLPGLPLSGARIDRSVSGTVVSARYLEALGATPYLGRDFSVFDETSESLSVLLSHGLWRTLGSDPNIVGKQLHCGGYPVEIIGVGPPGFTGTSLGRIDDLWLSLRAAENIGGWRRTDLFAKFVPGRTQTFRWVRTIVKLSPGDEFARAATLAAPLLGDTEFVPLRRAAIQPTARVVLDKLINLLERLTLSLLFIACANIIALQVAGLPKLRRDLTIRSMLGASSFQITALLLRDVLWLVGGALIVACASSVVLIELLRPHSLPGKLAIDTLTLRVDLPLIFLLAVGLITCVLFLALLPVSVGIYWHRRQHSGREAVVSPRFDRVHRIILAVQITLTVPLMATGILFQRDVSRAFHIPLGFDHRTVFLSADAKSAERYSLPAREAAARQVVDALSGISGVKSAAFGRTIFGPAVGMTSSIIWADGQRRALGTQYLVRSVGPKYLQIIGANLAAGRGIRESDRVGAPPVAVVTNALATRLWGSANNAVARFLQLEPRSVEFEVVGVVDDMVRESVKFPVRPTVFVAAEQAPALAARFDFVLNAHGDPRELLPRLEQGIRTVVPDAVVEPTIATQLIADEVSQQRIAAAVATCLSATAIGLCILGAWSVVMCAISYRQTEIGIRMAVGASASAILKQFAWIGAAPVCGGCLMGLIAWLALRHQLTPYMFILQPTDFWPAAVALTLVLGLTNGAGFVAAIETTKIAPADLLRG